MKLKTIHYVVFFVVIAFGGLFAARMWGETQPGPLDSLAQCITDSGATFYGAFWCAACDEQKRQFGNSTRLLPYTECSTADGRGQLQECSDASITNYPTWEFADKTRQTGVMTPTELSEKTGCELPV